MSDDFDVRVNFEGNAEELAAELARAIERGLGRAIADIQREFAQIFSGGQARRGASQAAQGAERVADGWERVRRNIRDASDAFRDFARRMNSVQTPDQALREYLRLLGQAERAQHELREERERAAEDPEFGRQIRTEARLRQQAASTQKDVVQELTRIVRTEFAKQAEAQRVSAQGATTRARAEASERIVIAQQEGSRIAAATRSAGQRRIEIMRFVFNQIRALERGIGAVIRGTASALGGVARGVGSTLGRVATAFRRSDRELATGLGPSLTRRESILRSSMSRQERIIQTSVSRQSVQIQRLESRLSTGVLGAATGRSGLGALLGGGLAIGGGFALFGALRNMVGAAQDFEQGLAVLGAQLQLSDRQMERVREKAIELGNDLTLPGVSAVQGAEAINLLTKQFGSLGKRAVPAATAAAKGVLQLSRATRSSAEESAQVVGAAINVFGINARAAVDVADQVTGALTKAAGVGFGDFALAFKQGATVFAQFQVPAVGAKEALIDFNTAIAVLARGGLVGSDAGTSLKQFFLQANRGTADSVKNLKLLTERAGETGTAFFDAAGKARPLSESLDIMRRGLQGLSDQERNKTLQKIFGSDAIRAANILLGTSEKTFETIEEGVRRSGVAAEIAAAQNTGLRGAMDALNSVLETQVVKVWRPLNRILGNVVLAFANFFNLLLTADEGPFKIIRDGLIGIAVGLGAVLAVKTGVEVIRLLGSTLPLLLTPMGLIAAAAATLGAAFFILRDRVPAFKAAIEDIGDAFSGVGGGALAFVQEQFGRLVAFLTETVLPKLAEFATTAAQFIADVITGSDVSDAWARGMEGVDTRTLGEKIGDKIREIFAVAREVIGNAQELLGDLFFGTDFADAFAMSITGSDTRSRFEQIGGQIREVFVTMARGISTALRAIVNAIKSFWHAIEPSIRPAIDGFHQLGDSLRDMVDNFSLGTLARIGGTIAALFAGFAVGGPVGAAVAGGAAAIALLFGDTLGSGLVESIGNLASLLREALAGPMQAAIDFITGFFSRDRLFGIVGGFLDIVEEIGRVIGSIVTDPRFIGVIAGIAAFAAVLVFRFTEGLARGIISNIPEWGRLFLDGLKTALRFAFDGIISVVTDPSSLAIATGLISTLFLGAGAIQRWRAAGQAAARTAGGGFFSTFRQFAAGGIFAPGAGGQVGGGARSFVTALFGGPNAINTAVISTMQGAQRAAVTQLQAMRRVIESAGRQIRILPDGQQDVRGTFAALTRDLGPSGVLGLGLRRAFQSSLQALRTRSLAPLRGLNAEFNALGLSLGRTLGGGVVSALAGAFAGIQVGQSLQGASGLQQILGVGGLALALGTVNPLLGVTAGLAGALTIAMGDTAGAAEVMTQRVNDVADALRGAEDPLKVLTERLQTDFAALAPNVQTALGELGFGVEDLLGKIKELGEDAPQGAAGVQTFVDLLEGNGPVLDQMVRAFEAGNISMSELLDTAANSTNLQRLGIGAEELRQILTFLTDAGIAATEGMELADLQARVFAGGLTEAEQSARNAHLEFQAAFKEPDNTITPAIQDVDERLGFLNTKAQTVKTSIGNLFGLGRRNTLRAALDDLILGLPGLASELESVLFPAEGVTITPQFLDATKRNVGDQLREGFKDLVINAETGQLRVRTLEGVDRIAERMRTAIRNQFGDSEIGLTLIAALDDLVLNENFRRRIRRKLQNLGEVDANIDLLLHPEASLAPGARESVQQQIQDAMTQNRRGGQPMGFAGGGGGESISVPIEIEPEVSVAGSQTDIGSGITDQIAAGVERGAPKISQSLNSAIGRALRSGSALASTFTQAGVKAAQGFAQGVAGGARLASQAGVAVGVEASQGAAAGSVGMAVAGTAASSTYAAGISAGAGTASGAASGVASAALGAFFGFSAYSAGLNLAYSFASGINAGASAAVNAAASMAQRSVDAARRTLQISSPSRVFREIGRDVGRGLALGLRDSETDIGSAVDRAISEAIERARGAVPGQAVARAEAGAGLFDVLLPGRLPGGPTAIDVHQALLDARDAIERVRDGIREVAEANNAIRRQIGDEQRALTDALRQVRERLSEAIQNAFSRGARGLDVARQRVNLGGLAGQVRTGIGDILSQALERREELLRRTQDTDLSDAERARAREALADQDRRIATLRQQIRALNINTVAGRAAANVILDFGQQIRDLGQSLLDSGASAQTVANTMARYRDQLIRSAQAQGISGQRLRELIQQLGLTDAQLQRFVTTSRNANQNAAERERDLREATQARIADLRADILANTNASRSLSSATAAGRQNRRVFIDAFQSIRAFGVELLRSGTSAQDAVAQMRVLRNNLVNNARAMGFNTNEIQDLLRMLGLTDAQLAEFVAQLGDLNDELERGNQNFPTGGSGPFVPNQTNVFNIDVPFGDPEAIAFTVANRIAFAAAS